VAKSDRSISKLIRLVSQSYEFEQYIRKDPKSLRRASRDRDQVVLEFLHQTIPPRFDPIPQPIEALYLLSHDIVSCSDSVNFSLDSNPSYNICFYPVLGRNAILYEVQVDTGEDLIIQLHNLTDNCTICVAKPGVSIFDSNLSNYFINPIYPSGDAPGIQQDKMVLEWEIIADILAQSPGQVGPYVVIYHHGSNPTAQGTVDFICAELPVHLSMACDDSASISLHAYTSSTALPTQYFEFGDDPGSARSLLLSGPKPSGSLGAGVILKVSPSDYKYTGSICCLCSQIRL